MKIFITREKIISKATLGLEPTVHKKENMVSAKGSSLPHSSYAMVCSKTFNSFNLIPYDAHYLAKLYTASKVLSNGVCLFSRFLQNKQTQETSL